MPFMPYSAAVVRKPPSRTVVGLSPTRPTPRLWRATRSHLPGCAGLGCTVLGRTGLGWTGLGCTGLGRTGLGRPAARMK